jgi:hypothetical protein
MSKVSVSRDGQIKVDGKPVGWVFRNEGIGRVMGEWRAEAGDPAQPETYKVGYAGTRKDAIALVVDITETGGEDDRSHGSADG